MGRQHRWQDLIILTNCYKSHNPHQESTMNQLTTQENHLDVAASGGLRFWELVEKTLSSRCELWDVDSKQRVSQPDADPDAVKDVVPATMIINLLGKNIPTEVMSTYSMGANQWLLVIPFHDNLYHPYLVVTQVENDQLSNACRIAELCIDQLELQKEVNDLRMECNQFLRQSTSDMEELTFFRQLCTFLELQNQDQDLKCFLEKIALQIKAEWIVFLPNEQIGKSSGFETPLNYQSYENPLQSSGFDLEKTLSLGSDCEIAKQLVTSYPKKFRQIVDNSIHQNHAFPGIQELLICPVVKADRSLGWLFGINRIQYPPNTISSEIGVGKIEFGTVESGLLMSASAMLATHISNLELLSANRELVLDVVRCLVSAIDSKDAYTRGHSERVAQYGRKLGEKLGMDPNSLERLYLSGLLHDIGKIGISDSVLAKTGKLTKEEFAEIMRHPEEGWKILQGLRQLENVLDGVLFHHERVDGDGYPDGLLGSSIPLDGRILAVADSFDAMTSDRPYRNGMQVEKAYQILKEGSGTQWDSKIIDAFLEISNDIEQIKSKYNHLPCPQRKNNTTQRELQ